MCTGAKWTTDRKAFRDLGQRMMKRRVEAEHLRNLRMLGADRVDSRQFLRDVQRGEVDHSLEILAYFRGQPDRVVVIRTAMDNAVPDRLRRRKLLRGEMIEHRLGVSAFLRPGEI